MITFILVVIGAGWAFSYFFGNFFILWIAVAFSLIMNVGAYWYSDRIVLSMSGAKEITRDQHRELWNITENLVISSGLPMPRLYIINDPAPNAFATGRNPEKGVVAVTSGLLERLDRNELEGVVAHELAHIKNRDILVMTVAVVLVGFVVLLADLFLRMTIYGGGGRDRGGGQLQIILIVAGFALMILAPIFAQLIQFAISRKREFLADASGALMSRYPEGLASALEKISSYNAPMRKASNATAHMFIANPFGAKQKKGMHRFFMTHPPVEERISALRGMETS